MVYKYLNLHFNQIEDVADRRKPIGLVKRFVEELEQVIAGFNFNKYYGLRSTGKPLLDPKGNRRVNPDGRIAMQTETVECRIEVRLNFAEANESQVLTILSQIADQEKTNGQIRDYDKAFVDTWHEPDFVKRAHELGTLWAIRVSDWLEENQGIAAELQSAEKLVGFAGQLVHLILAQAGLHSHILWANLRESPAYEKNSLAHDAPIVKLAQLCGDELQDAFKDIEQNLRPSFLERVFHCFFNCSFPPVVEGSVISRQMSGLLWKMTGRELKDIP